MLMDFVRESFLVERQDYLLLKTEDGYLEK
jgi:hypothetical protein